MQNKIKNFVRQNKVTISILLVVIAVGIFLRTYNFHDWLHFGSDQSRDAILVERVVNGAVSWPLLGADASNTHFKLGPMYYYFQIISVKIFGIGPEKLAYPDLLFSILSIPLLFFLLKRYFSTNISLALAAVYSFSYYAIRYSRFAWNTNPIPFFMMLFLLALHEFLAEKEKTSWWWIIIIGLALGVNVQLHTLLLLLLPPFTFFALVYLMKKNPKLWKQWMVIFLIAIILNLGQIISEKETRFANSQLFLQAVTDRSSSGGERLGKNLLLDMSAHTQANAHILSALGNRDKFDFKFIFFNPKKSDRIGYGLAVLGIVASYVFSILGYGALAYNLWKEKDEKKKYFLLLITIYVSLSFLAILPVIHEAPMRYFIHVSFIPFILLGFLLKTVVRKFQQKQILFIGGVVIILMFTNTLSVKAEAEELAAKARGDSGYVVLGEIEPMVEYIRSQSFPQKEAYLSGAARDIYFKSMSYVAIKRGFKLIRAKNSKSVPAGKPSFSISNSLSEKKLKHKQQNASDSGEFMNFGQIGIYKQR